MKKLLAILLLASGISELHAQSLQLGDLEASFLKHNLRVLAERYEVDKAEALLMQERLWPNPSLAVDNINLWSNSTVELQPAMIGHFGTKQQLGLELEQLIETAGKRKKRVAIRQAELQSSQLELQSLLLNLKFELRKSYFQFVQTQQILQFLDNAVSSFKEMEGRYAEQSQKQQVPASAYYRIHTERIALEKEQLAQRMLLHDFLKELRIMTMLPTLKPEQIAQPDFNLRAMNRDRAYWMKTAQENNPSLKTYQQQIVLQEKQWSLEKAQAVPDLSFLLQYERGGNIMQNFVGVGIKMDLPVFNRNKGGIAAARSQHLQSEQVLNFHQQELQQDIDVQLHALADLEELLRQWASQPSELAKGLLQAYSKQLAAGQITLMEYLDFVEAARNAEMAKLEVQKDYLISREELQLLLGTDI